MLQIILLVLAAMGAVLLIRLLLPFLIVFLIRVFFSKTLEDLDQAAGQAAHDIECRVEDFSAPAQEFFKYFEQPLRALGYEQFVVYHNTAYTSLHAESASVVWKSLAGDILASLSYVSGPKGISLFTRFLPSCLSQGLAQPIQGIVIETVKENGARLLTLTMNCPLPSMPELYAVKQCDEELSIEALHALHLKRLAVWQANTGDQVLLFSDVKQYFTEQEKQRAELNAHKSHTRTCSAA